MATTRHTPDATELLLHEIREEAGRILHHPIRETRRLKHVAADGMSPATPWLVMLAVISGLALVLAAIMAASMYVYYNG